MTTGSHPEPLSPRDRQAASVRKVDHRPWPLPSSSWVMGQTWRDLLFAHWRVEIESLRPLVPDVLEIDTFDGAAWIGVTPFELEELRMRGLPPVPRVSRFLELNVRTYVTLGGKPGVLFFSLDASSLIGVWGARLLYRLPYFHARMSARRDGDWIEFASIRLGAREERSFGISYRPTAEPFRAQPGSLEHFLTERYCLYTVTGHAAAHRAEIHHAPWDLQVAEARIERNTMLPAGLSVAGAAPFLHFASLQDVVVWPLGRVSGAAPGGDSAV